MSVNAPQAIGEEKSLLDVLADRNEASPDHHLIQSSLKQEIARSLATLTLREADIIVCYFGLNGSHPMTLEEIGNKFSLTQERVRQIKVRHSSRNKLLKSYL